MVVVDIPVVVDEDHVGGSACMEKVVFINDVGADHAACFADVEQFGPVVVPEEFICGESPSAHPCADGSRDSGIIGEEEQEASEVSLVFLGMCFALSATHRGVSKVRSEKVGTDGDTLVDVAFGVWGFVEGEEEVDLLGIGGEVAKACDDLVIVGVIVSGPFEGDPVFGIPGEAGAEARCLEERVFGAMRAFRCEDA